MFSRSSKLSFFVALIIATLACNALTRTAPNPETPQVSTTSVSASQPTITVDDFKIAEGGGVSFQYPTNLIQGVDVVQVPAEIDSPTPHPAYTQFTLKGYPINSDTTPAQILVYPIKEFTSLVPSIADDLKALKELKSYETDKPIPFPRIIYANPLFDERRSGTFLPGGISGFLFLTQFGQDISPITNEGLTHVFIGQSENGLLIVAFFPVNAPGLPASFKDVNSNEWQNNFPEYIKGIKRHLLSLQPNDFTPNLDVLDKIIYSLKVDLSNQAPNNSSATSEFTSQVLAKRSWADVGVYIEAGKHYKITATGKWNVCTKNGSPFPNSPNGCGQSPCGRYNSSVPMLQVDCGALIGKITPTGVPFFIGQMYEFTANDNGALLLGVNDSSDGLFDNSGQLKVVIQLLSP